jgi:hypothetical protein
MNTRISSRTLWLIVFLLGGILSVGIVFWLLGIIDGPATKPIPTVVRATLAPSSTVVQATPTSEMVKIGDKNPVKVPREVATAIAERTLTAAVPTETPNAIEQAFGKSFRLQTRGLEFTSECLARPCEVMWLEHDDIESYVVVRFYNGGQYRYDLVNPGEFPTDVEQMAEVQVYKIDLTKGGSRQQIRQDLEAEMLAKGWTNPTQLARDLPKIDENLGYVQLKYRTDPMGTETAAGIMPESQVMLIFYDTHHKWFELHPMMGRDIHLDKIVTEVNWPMAEVYMLLRDDSAQWLKNEFISQGWTLVP